MSNEIATMNDLKTRISDKIKSSFVELIPEQQWNKLVEAELDNFTRNEIPKLLKEELTKRFREEVQAELEKPEYMQGMWNGTGYDPGEAVETILKNSAHVFVQAMFGDIVQSAIIHLQNNMRRGY